MQMMSELTHLRLFGLVLGAAGVAFSLLYFRGPRWNRFNFVLALVGSMFIAVVSAEPATVNWLRDFLSLDKSEYGRLLGLLIVGTIGCFLLLLYTRAQAARQKQLVDRLIRAFGVKELAQDQQVAQRVKPIMVIIPALNEEENLRVLLPAIPRAVHGMDVGVLVIDDGSTDDTALAAQQADALVVRNIVNRGQGAASRLGYDILKRYGVTIGVTMDADNQHRPEDIAPLVEPVLQNRLDLVIGSRILGNREKDSAVRYLGIKLLSAAINALTGLHLTDCSSGFKAFRLEKLSALHLYEEQFQAAETLIVAAKAGLRIGEVPIYIRRRGFGTSKKGTNLRYGLVFAKTIVKTWWR